MSSSVTTHTSILNAVLNNTPYAVATAWLSLHDDDPAGTGANEIAGGSYIRQQVPKAAASSGEWASTGSVAFADMPEADLTHLGLWTAATGGSFITGGAVQDAPVSVPQHAMLVIEPGDLTAAFGGE